MVYEGIKPNRNKGYTQNKVTEHFTAENELVDKIDETTFFSMIADKFEEIANDGNLTAKQRIEKLAVVRLEALSLRAAMIFREGTVEAQEAIGNKIDELYQVQVKGTQGRGGGGKGADMLMEEVAKAMGRSRKRIAEANVIDVSEENE